MSFFENSRQAKYVRHEEKQENLSRFTGFYLDRLSVSDETAPGQRQISLLARSPQSPVAVVLMDAMPEIRALGVSLRVSFVRLEPQPLLAAWLDLAETARLAAPAASIRWARNPALIDAHEQLVLGTSMSWLGDCMRREPERRDAYETFHTFDADSARQTMAFFETLWSMSAAVPFAPRKPAPAAEPPDVGSAATSGTPQSTGSTVTASTRH